MYTHTQTHIFCTFEFMQIQIYLLIIAFGILRVLHRLNGRQWRVVLQPNRALARRELSRSPALNEMATDSQI